MKFTNPSRNFIGILGLSIMILASLIYQPLVEGKSNQRYGISFFSWFFGLLIIGFWFFKVETVFRKRISMIFAVIGQVLMWHSIASTLMQGYNPQLLSLTIPSMILCWVVALLFARIKRVGRYKSVERRNFSPSTQRQILINQGNSCAICRCDLSSKIVQFDHIDGDRSNNDNSNCQALSSNCHSEKTRNGAS